MTLWGLRLVILAKGELKNKISHISQSTVKTGIANALGGCTYLILYTVCCMRITSRICNFLLKFLGNKGAVAVSFHFNGSSFCFVNCHLTSGHERNNRYFQRKNLFVESFKSNVTVLAC